MPATAAKTAPFDLTSAMLYAFDTNEKVNQFMLDQMPTDAWRSDPPTGKGRTIAAIVAHMHNVRVMWLKAAAKGSKIPGQLERDKVTIAGARKGLAESHAALRTLIEASLKSDGRIKGFKPDVGSFLGYLFAHDAHHRGQAMMLARQTGHPLPQSAQFGMWEWGKLGRS
jgi:uncharacterized damage-inducible protein DinB